jgi:hypothetical protein
VIYYPSKVRAMKYKRDNSIIYIPNVYKQKHPKDEKERLHLHHICNFYHVKCKMNQLFLLKIQICLFYDQFWHWTSGRIPLWFITIFFSHLLSFIQIYSLPDISRIALCWSSVGNSCFLDSNDVEASSCKLTENIVNVYAQYKVLPIRTAA